MGGDGPRALLFQAAVPGRVESADYLLEVCMPAEDGSSELQLVRRFGDGDPEAGKPRRDRNNPDESKQNEPLVGLSMLKGFDHVGENKWANGTIYDPENGRTYKCEITFVIPEKPEDPNAPYALIDFKGVGRPAFSAIGAMEKP